MRNRLPVKIATIGLGPSFMDIAMMFDTNAMRDKIELVGYSSDGRLRHDYTDKADHTEYRPHYIATTKEDGTFCFNNFISENAFFDRLAQEMKRAHESGFSTKDVEYVVKCYLEALNSRQGEVYNLTLLKKLQKSSGQVRLRNTLKQTDPNSAATVARMLEAGTLRTVARRLTPDAISTNPEGGFTIATENTTEHFDLVINCSARERLTSTALLQQCIENNLIQILEFQGKDFPMLDEHNQASENMYLGGALAVNYCRNAQRVIGDVGVGAVMLHAKKIAGGVIEKLKKVEHSQTVFYHFR